MIGNMPLCCKIYAEFGYRHRAPFLKQSPKHNRIDNALLWIIFPRVAGRFLNFFQDLPLNVNWNFRALCKFQSTKLFHVKSQLHLQRFKIISANFMEARRDVTAWKRIQKALIKSDKNTEDVHVDLHGTSISIRYLTATNTFQEYR